jgi:hypothetical protein
MKPEDKILAAIQEVREHLEGMSPETKVFFARVCDEIFTFAQDQQVPPRQVAAALGSVIGMMAMVEAQWDTDDEAAIDEFLSYTGMAMQVGASIAKINAPRL